jgi:hypothetical protein
MVHDEREAALMGLLLLAVTSPTASASPGPPTVAGVLVRYVTRGHSGSFTVQQRDGKRVQFVVSLPMRIDGYAVTCGRAPERGGRRDPNACAYWPAYLLLGTTPVRVAYHEQTLKGRAVLVSGAMTTGPAPTPLPRKATPTPKPTGLF